MKKIQNLGFACRLETINAVEAWRGSLPGDGYRNVRRVLLHTLNLADLLPITSVWAGLRENPSRLMPKHSPPLLFAATTGATPFRVNLHVADLGHTLMCGPSGRGQIDGARADRGAMVPISARPGVRVRQGLLALRPDEGGRRRVLRPGWRKDGSRLLPATGNRLRRRSDVGGRLGLRIYAASTA